MTHSFNKAVEEAEVEDQVCAAHSNEDVIAHVAEDVHVQCGIESESGEEAEEETGDSSTKKEEAFIIPVNVCEDYILQLLDLDEGEMDTEARHATVDYNTASHTPNAFDAIQEKEEQDKDVYASHAAIRRVCCDILGGFRSVSIV